MPLTGRAMYCLRIGAARPYYPRCLINGIDYYGVAIAPKSDQLRVVAVDMANPEGAKAREPYQNFYGEGLPSE